MEDGVHGVIGRGLVKTCINKIVCVNVLPHTGVAITVLKVKVKSAVLFLTNLCRVFKTVCDPTLSCHI